MQLEMRRSEPPESSTAGAGWLPCTPRAWGGGEEEPGVCTAKFDCRTTVRLRDLA